LQKSKATFWANEIKVSNTTERDLTGPTTPVQIHHKKKDGGCTFYHNTLRTKLSPLGKWKDMG